MFSILVLFGLNRAELWLLLHLIRSGFVAKHTPLSSKLLCFLKVRKRKTAVGNFLWAKNSTHLHARAPRKLTLKVCLNFLSRGSLRCPTHSLVSSGGVCCICHDNAIMGQGGVCIGGGCRDGGDMFTGGGVKSEAVAGMSISSPWYRKDSNESIIEPSSCEKAPCLPRYSCGGSLSFMIPLRTNTHSFTQSHLFSHSLIHWLSDTF